MGRERAGGFKSAPGQEGTTMTRPVLMRGKPGKRAESPGRLSGDRPELRATKGAEHNGGLGNGEENGIDRVCHRGL